MLTLPIKKKWFDMILDGEKTEEYRDITKYYISRLARYISKPFMPDEDKERLFVVFRNGYRKDSPSFVVRCTVRIGKGKTEWGAEKGEEYFVLDIEDVFDVKLQKKYPPSIPFDQVWKELKEENPDFDWEGVEREAEKYLKGE